MAYSLFWSLVWSSPLKKDLPSNLQLCDLTKEATLGSGTFGVVIKFKKQTAEYAGRKLPEDFLSTNATRRDSYLKKFAKITRQLCSARHPNMVKMYGVFFCDSVTYLPVLVYEKLDLTLKQYLSVNRPEVYKMAVLQDVASGLKYIHGLKPPILHLNLTVDNVFVCETKDPIKLPTAKISDAGVTSLVMNVYAGESKLPKYPPTCEYLFKEEKQLVLDSKFDVLCFGVLMGHVVVQETIVKTLPIFFDDPSASAPTADQLMMHEQLEVHPLYPLLSKCLNKTIQSRPTAADIRDYLYSHADEVKKWSETNVKEFHEWIKKSQTSGLSIMITGKTGSGKTSLINGLIGKKVGEEGEGLDRMTDHVEPKELTCEGTLVKIWDTPGLQDDTKDEDRYLQEMKENCSDCDLYIYCLSMKQTRFDTSEIQTIQKLTETFGKDFWAKVLFVLTFANEMEASFSEGSDVERLFTDKIKAWHTKLVHRLKECGVKKEVADNIQVIPAGYSKPLKGSPNPWKLPGIPNWFHNFWYKCAETMDEKGIPVLVTINIRRLKSPEEISKLDLRKCPIEEQPIPLSQQVAMAAAGGIAAFSGWGTITFGMGAIGVVVGALCGSIAGPVGIAVGEIVGLAVGNAVGSAVGKVVAKAAADATITAMTLKYKRRKEKEKQEMSKKEHGQDKTQKE